MDQSAHTDALAMDETALVEALIAEHMWGEKLIDKIVDQYRVVLKKEFGAGPELETFLRAYKEEKTAELHNCWSEDSIADLRRTEKFVKH